MNILFLPVYFFQSICQGTEGILFRGEEIKKAKLERCKLKGWKQETNK